MRTQTHEAGGPGLVSEATLFQQARAGCSASLNALMDRHDGLVQAVVRQQVLGDLPFAEALQAGRIGPLRVLAAGSGGPSWASTPRGVWPSPPTPGPALCTRSGGQSRCTRASIRRR